MYCTFSERLGLEIVRSYLYSFRSLNNNNYNKIIIGLHPNGLKIKKEKY